MKFLPPHLVKADGLSTSASGMAAQRVRLNTIANNIANMHTTRGPNGEFAPYLRKEVIFRTQEVNDNFPDEQGVRVQDVLPNATSIKSIYDPTHPEADNKGYRLVPGIPLPLEMANMIEASRAYEANLRAMKVSGGATRKNASILEPVKG